MKNYKHEFFFVIETKLCKKECFLQEEYFSNNIQQIVTK